MPLEQLSNNLDFFSFFVASKLGVTGLTVTVDVWKHLTSTNTSSQIITAGSATEVGGGLYRYQLSSASVTDEGEYICIFKTSSATPDQQHIPTIWCVQKSGSEYLDAAVTSRANATDYTSTRAGYLDRLDATISSRQATGNVTVAGYASGQDPATLVWAASTRTLSGFGFSVTVGTNNDKTGYALAVTPPTAQQVWDTLTSATTMAGSVGKRIADNLDATIASRMATFTYTAPDNTSVGTILTRTDVATSTRASATDYTTVRAAKLDNLDATISSRLASASYTASSITSLQADVTAIKVKTDANLDTTVSSRFAPAGLTSLQADVTAIVNVSPANSAIYAKVADAIFYATDARDKAWLNYQVLYGATVPAGSMGEKLNVIKTDVTAIKGPVVAYIDAGISSRLAASAYAPSSGAGAIAYTVTLLQPGTVTPIAGAEVWITSDSAGATVVAGTLLTNGSGQSTFMVDAGSYYLWVQATGWNFTNPQPFVVS